MKAKSTWRARLRSVYTNFGEFITYARAYNLPARLGYPDAFDAWTANPIVEGSVAPRVYRALTRPKPKTTVLFRTWRANPRTVIAIFPEHPATHDLTTCMSYEHLGQHGTCDPEGLIAVTRPAKPREYKELLRELKQIGYFPRVRKRLQAVYRTTRSQLVENWTLSAELLVHNDQPLDAELRG